MLTCVQDAVRLLTMILEGDPSDDDLSPLLVILSSLTKLGHDVLVVLTRPPSLIAIVSLNSGSNSSF